MKKYIFASLLLCLAITSFAQNAYFTYNKAYGQLVYENYEAAITLFTQAIKEKPDFADAYSNRGLAYHKLGKLDNAIPDYIKDNTLMKDRSSYNLACAYALQGRNDDAFRLLEQCQKSQYKQLASSIESDTDFTKLKSDPRWKPFLAKDYFTPYDKVMIEVNEKFSAKDYDGALQACDKAIAIDRTDKRAIISKGYILGIQGKFEQSLSEYDKILLINPNDYEGFAGKANVFYVQKKYSQALPLYENATIKNSSYLPLYETGMCKYATGLKSEGIEDLKKYAEIFPKDDFTQYTCARFLYDQLRENEALPYIQNAIALNESTPEYYLLRANIKQVTKNFDDAINDYTKVISFNGDTKGEAYYKRGICKAEKYAKTKNAADKTGFCSDMEAADAQGIKEATQYLRELCD